MSLDMTNLANEYLGEHYDRIFEETAWSVLQDYGYKYKRGTGYITFNKGNIQVWVWPRATELEFCVPDLKYNGNHEALNKLKEKLNQEICCSKVMYIEELTWDKKGFYLIGTFDVDKYIDERVFACVEAVEEFFKKVGGQ